MTAGTHDEVALLAQAECIAHEFDIAPEIVQKVTHHFVRQMRDGLAHQRNWQLPSYVTNVPTGREQGEFLAVDLGGSNCRICLVDLHGDSTFTVIQSKHRVPADVMINESYRPLFSFIAEKLSEFLENHAQSHNNSNAGSTINSSLFSLGFTFSFTCEQTSLAGGRLIRWDKGWDIPEAVGRDPCMMLQEAIDEMHLPVRVSVLANDSVGTLLTRSYTSGGRGSTLAGVIFGTGTNAAYVEKLPNVRRLGAAAEGSPSVREIMVINTEWGCFDDEMIVLPRTPYDDELDISSIDSGSQMLEKRVSGLYLGELLRLALLKLSKAGAFQMTISELSPIYKKDSIDSAFLSQLADSSHDSTAGVPEKASETIAAFLLAENVSSGDVRAIKLIASAIGRRAARLAGASLAAIVIQSQALSTSESILSSKAQGAHIEEHQVEPGPRLTISRFQRFLGEVNSGFRKLMRYFGLRCFLRERGPSAVEAAALQRRSPEMVVESSRESEETEAIVDVGADGSLIEFYPGFEAEMRGSMREVVEIGPSGEQRIRIGLAKDGSGVGAALMAQAASRSGISS
ncbi:hypothetical protein BX600DRAFT_482639 [Xylariales sp. PMI_506]|nr:hypothetical protein BX600DRAFT_482639 [Xylariales sp. PMI_506]